VNVVECGERGSTLKHRNCECGECGRTLKRRNMNVVNVGVS